MYGRGEGGYNNMNITQNRTKIFIYTYGYIKINHTSLIMEGVKECMSEFHSTICYKNQTMSKRQSEINVR